MAFTIREVEATQTLVYTPETYLEFCQLQGEEPSNDGFLAYIQQDIDDDFDGYNGCLLIRHNTDDH